ncbi:DUF2829 domain-containing protein (plasmid) [Azospirillum sp. HJ39]|uniref:DUF2829 domain-containing protein n=1 Tax=Azospirillum sp. HJ39 TaxID=3159496 RepID=UPI003558626E
MSTKYTVIHQDGRFQVGTSRADEAGGFAVLGDITDQVPFIVKCATPEPLTSGMDFGQAIRALKAGKRVARAGWNGKGMWLALPCSGSREVPAHGFWSEHNRRHAEQSGGYATVLPSITMKTATDEILMGWLASQTDMLAEDWCVVEG